jgi:CheY-like chemotaxis protein
VELEICQDALWVEASPPHLEKSLKNLLLNAVQAAKMSKNEDGKIKVSVKKTVLDTPIKGYDLTLNDSYAVLEVSDNGQGIPKEDEHKVFEPFYTGKLWGGRGLGLTVVMNTAKALGGGVDLTSTPNGTTFKMYLPICKEGVPDLKKVKKEKKDLSKFFGKGEKILVVDDVDIQRKLATKMLKTLGYTAYALSSGEKAVEYLKNNSVDLLILDMIMPPGINGRETYQRILSFNPKQKAIIASGMAEGEEVEKAKTLGATHFIPKPYTIEVIAEAIFQALNDEVIEH